MIKAGVFYIGYKGLSFLMANILIAFPQLGTLLTQLRALLPGA